MIIADFNGIAISTVVIENTPVDEDMIRHMILNTIRMYNKRHKNEYGEMVIACDHRSWRKDYFKQYKHSRKKGRDTSTYDWDEVFRIINLVRDELLEHFPYRVIHIDGAEADDIIGTLVESYAENEKILILSADKDFIQLQRYKNVAQYSPAQKKFVTHNNPAAYLFEHIVKGDKGDGVPNILSHDNVFVEGERQKPITKKKLEELSHLSDSQIQNVLGETIWRNFCRNKKLVDLRQTPDDLKREIINIYENQEKTPGSKVLPFLIQKRCRRLIESVHDFL